MKSMRTRFEVRRHVPGGLCPEDAPGYLQRKPYRALVQMSRVGDVQDAIDYYIHIVVGRTS